MYFSLLAYCLYNQVDWEDIAYIQQHKKIDNAINIQVKLRRYADIEEKSLLDICPELIEEYGAYLIIGDTYVSFINDKNNSDVNMREFYTKYPEKLNAYLGYMAGHFTLTGLATPVDDESKTERVSKMGQDWLVNYAKALRNMAEEVISLIKKQRSLSKDQRRVLAGEVVDEVLVDLNAWDEQLRKNLSEKSSNKLLDFIEKLRECKAKVVSGPDYRNTQFFTSASLTSTENKLPSEITQAKTNSL